MPVYDHFYHHNRTDGRPRQAIVYRGRGALVTGYEVLRTPILAAKGTAARTAMKSKPLF